MIESQSTTANNIDIIRSTTPVQLQSDDMEKDSKDDDLTAYEE